jgi:hypothetical protein
MAKLIFRVGLAGAARGVEANRSLEVVRRKVLDHTAKARNHITELAAMTH